MTDRAPYPGLRPFRPDEVDLFFGREGDLDQIVDRLTVTRFVAVLGASGSGKSSLVQTGLIEALKLGLLAEAGSDWTVAVLKPGSNPLANLARALAASRTGGEIDQSQVEMLAAFLRRGPRAIVEWCGDGHLGPNTSLLLVVDQFEELFRYDSYATREQAQAFVNLLIESAEKREGPRIFVVLTMRSEYLGACSLIDGLVEAINRGQYLTPRMTREQCRRAIVDPAGVCGAVIEPALVSRLLNDLGAFAPWDDDGISGPLALTDADPLAKGNPLDRLARRADQLPLMSHVLNRLWSKSRARGDSPPRLSLNDYTSNGLRDALSAHANEVMEDLTRKHDGKIQDTIQTIFRALVSGGSVADAVRRPTEFQELVKLAGGRREEVLAVLEAYRALGCSFVTPESSTKLKDETTVDISHESLIRQWDHLRNWVSVEGAAGSWWRKLADDAVAWKRVADDPGPEADSVLRRGLELTRALELMDAYHPSPAWSERYGGQFEIVEEFLVRSLKVQSQGEATQRRERWVRYGAMTAVCLAVAAVILWLVSDQRLKESSRQTGMRAFNTVLMRAQELQERGLWHRSGALLGTVVDPLLTRNSTGLHLPESFPENISRTLKRVLVRQNEHLRAIPLSEQGGQIQAVFGDADHQLTAVAWLDDDKNIGVYRASLDGRVKFSIQMAALLEQPVGRDDKPNEMVTSSKGNQASDVSAMAFYASGDRLGIAVGDQLVLVEISRDGLKVLNRVSAGVERRPDESADRSSFSLSSIDSLAACGEGGTQFIAQDFDTVWLLNVVDGRISPRKLFSGKAVRKVSVEPGGKRYAILSEASTLHVGDCNGSAGTSLVPLRVDIDIRDVEFTSVNLLAVAGSARDVMFFEANGSENRWRQHSQSIHLPPGASLSGFGSGFRMWLSYNANYTNNGRQYVGYELRLWNALSGSDEGVIDPLKTRLEPPIILGNTNWVAWNFGGEPIVVQEAVSLPMAQLAALANVVGGGTLQGTSDDEDPDNDSNYVRVAWQNLDVAGWSIRKEPQVSTTDPGCTPTLNDVADALELQSVKAEPGKRASEQRPSGSREQRIAAARQMLERTRRACGTAISRDSEEKELADRLILERFGDISETIDPLSDETRLSEETRSRINSLALRLSPAALRVFAVALREQDLIHAANAVDKTMFAKGIASSYQLVEDARSGLFRENESVVQKKGSADGRDQELLAWFLVGNGNRKNGGGNEARSEALRHFSFAQKNYQRVGDSYSVDKVSAARDNLGMGISDADLLSLWPITVSDQTKRITPNGPGWPEHKPATGTSSALEDWLRIVAPDADDPRARAELLLALAKTSQIDATGMDRMLSLALDAAARTPLSERADINSFLVRVAQSLAAGGAPHLAAAAATEYLLGIDHTVINRPDSDELESQRRLLRQIKDVTKIAISGKAAEQPDLRARLSKMTWRFVHPDWMSSDVPPAVSDAMRECLSEALKLEEALAATGASDPDLLFAMADTSFWLGVLNSGKDVAETRRKYLDAAITHFETLKKAAVTSPRIRLQWAEALRVSALIPALTFSDSRAKWQERADSMRRVRAMYEGLLQYVDGLGNSDYLLVAAVAGTGNAYGHLGNSWAFVAMKALSDNDVETAYRAALESVRNVHKRAVLYAPDRFERVKAANPNSEYLDARPAHEEDAWMVGLLAGYARITGVDAKVPTPCEAMFSHIIDPERHALGVEFIKPGDVHVDGCIHTLENEPPSPGNEFLLGRLYTSSGRSEEKAKMLEHYVRAGTEGYAMAYHNLALLDLLTSCTLKRPLNDRYRYLVLHNYLQMALPALRKYSKEPTDEAAFEWLASEGKIEPKSTEELPPLGTTLRVKFLEEKCP